MYSCQSSLFVVLQQDKQCQPRGKSSLYVHVALLASKPWAREEKQANALHTHSQYVSHFRLAPSLKSGCSGTLHFSSLVYSAILYLAYIPYLFSGFDNT